MEGLDQLFQETVAQFNSFEHTPNFLIGSAIVIIGLLIPVFFNYFQQYILIRWMAKWIPSELRESETFPNQPPEAIVTGAKTYLFFPFTSITGPPDPELRPMLSIMVPIGLFTVGILAMGMMVMVTDYWVFIPLGFIGTAVIGYICYRFAIWQLKRGTW